MSYTFQNGFYTLDKISPYHLLESLLLISPNEFNFLRDSVRQVSVKLWALTVEETV